MFEADRVVVTILVENWIDMLLPESPEHGICRCGLIEHFDQALTPPVAENGISLHVEVHSGERRFAYLFDFGLTGHALIHNVLALGINPREWRHLILSHGHPDHYGGIYDALKLAEHGVGVATHPDAFLPRYAVMGDGRVASTYNNSLTESSIEAAGGTVVLSRQPLDIGPGVLTTGEIPRKTAFEGPPAELAPHAAGLYQVKNGEWVVDQVWDEQALIVNVRNRGLVVLTGCGHAGVINTVQHAIELTGTERVAMVAGGFHLGFPTTPRENVALTMNALSEFTPSIVMPSHCSGLAALVAAREAFAASFFQYAVGTRIAIG
jgi:7,8-dihydropterin-6-yl-methyl-4-(beta-D-ribofuranosyl)aminobenzene 5'-phosphate synthase